MTDQDLIAKKLALIETYVHELRTLSKPRVHGYAAIDPAIVRDVVENHLGDLLDFVVAVRTRLVAPGS